VITELMQALEKAGCINSADTEKITKAVIKRETEASTGLGKGVAIPHGRVKGLRDAAAAFVKMQTPIPFDAPDGLPVKFIFVLLVPERATDLHLQILGELAQMFSEQSFRDRLEATDDPTEMHQLFNDWNA